MSDAPGPEHELLAGKVGVWDVECEYFVGAEAEPLRARGVDTVRALGPYWVLAEAEFEIPGMTIRGQAASGYDPVARCFRSTWIDTVTPFLFLFEGSYDAETGLLALEGMNREPHSRREVLYKSEEIFGTPDDRIFELRVESTPGVEVPVLRYQYSRRK